METPTKERQTLLQALQKYWGYGEFLPLQNEAMQCVLAGHDSVVVLPTGALLTLPGLLEIMADCAVALPLSNSSKHAFRRLRTSSPAYRLSIFAATSPAS